MSVNTEPQKKERGLEKIKWLSIIILLITAIVGNYYYREISLPLRIIFVIVLMSIAAGLALLTKKGKSVLTFAREARIEVYKVIWPSPRETLYSTFIVALVTTLMSLILWGLDGILVHLVSFITSLRF